VQFSRLRISGFKSFVEPTELAIYPGLTGVVGPNGCGKSNLVEALRWVMGETSAKSVRGSAMDDVIFSGTANRPARNVAEVALHLDNSERRAPAAFNNTTELEVVRRIEREQGSAYLINGQEVRARDVQLLFADLVTGAHSPAMVSQGRVAALIGAKPADRRRLLEEAAGITGLHSRRHEAELKLRAAEQNLARVDDVIAQMESQLQSLKRQARQAKRYRNLSSYIRKAEALRFHLLFVQAEADLRAAGADLAACEGDVGQLGLALAAAQGAELAANEKLPNLRQMEAEAGARLHRLAVARDGLEAEEARAREDIRNLDERLAQIDADLVREQMLSRQGLEASRNLAAEERAIADSRAAEAAILAAAESDAQSCAESVNASQAELDRASEALARAQALNLQWREAAARALDYIARLTERLDRIAADRADLLQHDRQAELIEASAATLAAREKSAAARARVDACESHRAQTNADENSAREIWRKLHDECERLRAEEAGLLRLLGVNENDLWPPLIDAVAVEAGYERALGVALGDDLSAPADRAAPVHWETLEGRGEGGGALPPLPQGALALGEFVKGPAALSRRLSQIGVVDETAGDELRARLQPGQRLVSLAGSLWRWDGYTVRAGAATQSSARLESRSRLGQLREQLRAPAADEGAAEAAWHGAQNAAEAAKDSENLARAVALDAEAELAESREKEDEAQRADAARNAKLLALEEAEANSVRERHAAEAAGAEANARLANADLEAGLRDRLAQARREDESCRQGLAGARATLDELRRQSQTRAERLAAIARELQVWRERNEESARQLELLSERKAKSLTEQAELAQLPDAIAARQSALLDQLSIAEAARNQAADALAEAETVAAALGRETRAAQATLSEARENLVRRQERAEQAAAALTDLGLLIQSTVDAAPDQLLNLAEVDAAALPELAQIEHRVDRLKKERDTMGPVNLRAEIEADDVGVRHATLAGERNDLTGAIERLRQGIGSLNREGRERLLTAFKTVDEHFQTLFKQLFGGGRAHLTLTESDDPLEAGLEIMASPPGKRLQTLTLLSGGEQALTALAMLFAMFLTNPAPICVLDEVDAALDDANVERLCNLLNELLAASDTRFLVITHNPITMARMNRLFGVTMSERGVSMLTSVDLAGAEALRATA
jgi:chromosome segregation protein